MYYKNKVIWITGASSGTGEALVYELAEKDADIIISARREDELKRVKNNCKNPDNIFILPLDLEKHEELPEKAKTVIDKYKRIDILFNNGGVSQRSLAENTDINVDKRLMNINYFGTVILTKAVLPQMIKQKSGHIIVMTSLTGKFGTPLRSAYAASKHALHGFFDSLRAEIYKYNISVTLICAGFIRTRIAINALTENGEKQNADDPKTKAGMSPKYFAKKTLKAVAKKKEEFIIGGKEKYGVYIKRFFPNLFSKIIRKANVR
ncbi:MAG: SDR family oxidoreductase [Chlorobi bacterium]|nr:SDR family oxidoreductase [Chlorobiota bacterium]